MNIENIIILGLPKGSLNTPGRCYMKQIFETAGYTMRGYDSGKESYSPIIVNDSDIRCFLVRPQDVPLKLREGIYDIGITGEDQILEDRAANGQNTIVKVGDLGVGKVRIICAVGNDSECKSLSEFFLSKKEIEETVRCYTEYPYLTRQTFMQNTAYQSIYGNKTPIVEAKGSPTGENQSVKIFLSNGATEGCIADGSGNIFVDNTQSGDSLKRSGTKPLGRPILESCAGLYMGPSCVGWKAEKARAILVMLNGTCVADKENEYKFTFFNTPMTYAEEMRQVLPAADMCADEPTITLGKYFASVNILIPKIDYPRIVAFLREAYQATSIVTLEVSQFIR